MINNAENDCLRAAYSADGRRSVREGSAASGMAAHGCSASADIVERPGVYELPMGYSLRKAIYEVAGGVKDGKKLKAVVPGRVIVPRAYSG